MKKSVKFVSAILSGVMALSLAGCSSGSSNKKVVKEAEAVLEEITSLDYKSMKARDAYSKQYIDMVKSISKEETNVLLWSKAKITVDSDSVKTKKGKTTCEATVDIIEYKTLVKVFTKEYRMDEFDDDDEAMEAMKEIIDKVKEKDYTSIDVTLEFEEDDGDYLLENGDEIFQDLFFEVFQQVDGNPYVEKSKENQEKEKARKESIESAAAEDD